MTKQQAPIPARKTCQILAGLLLSILLFPLTGLASPIGAITKIHVQEQGIGPQSEGCTTFMISPAQVKAFFARAVLISSRQQHDFFSTAPALRAARYRAVMANGSGLSATWAQLP